MTTIRSVDTPANIPDNALAVEGRAAVSSRRTLRAPRHREAGNWQRQVQTRAAIEVALAVVIALVLCLLLFRAG